MQRPYQVATHDQGQNSQASQVRSVPDKHVYPRLLTLPKPSMETGGENQGGLRIIHRSSTQEFRKAVWGRVFNGIQDPSRRPLAVVDARSVADVIATVRLAAAQNARVSIRSGGHSWAAW